MPNKRAHLAAALITGLIAGFLLYDNLIYSLIFGLLSGVTGSLPDRIEKPTNSLHRGFFHSIIFFFLLVIVLVFTVWLPLSGLVFGYLTHLLLDYARTTHKPLV